MKTIIHFARRKNLIVCFALLLSSAAVFSQPDYKFINPILQSGTDKSIGAVYRFKNVKPGVDGLMTIADIFKLSLNNIDGNANGGFNEAFQPEIHVPKKTNGYIEFQLDFVTAGTNTPQVMTEVPLTSIDIDGYQFPDDKIYEFDEFAQSPSYYVAWDFLGSALDVKYQGSWVHVENTSAVNYPGVDTIQRDVMFTMVHAGVSTIKFRVGANNKSKNADDRLRSVYFKKFNFPIGSILHQSQLIRYNGTQQKNSVTLNWEFSSIEGIKNCVVERSTNGQAFLPVGTVLTGGEGQGLTYSYTDPTAGAGTYTYRLLVTGDNSQQFYSQIISFKQNSTGPVEKMNIYPNIIQNRASVQISSETAVKTSLQIVDYTGKVVYQQPVILSAGTTSLNLELTGKIARGSYIVAVPVNSNLISEKVLIQ